ncbi:hypothetical protein H8D85_01150 [bacterium]|nr:hypothetical protein [bacterium]
MKKKIDLEIYDNENNTVYKDKDGEIIAVYIPNEVTTAPSVVEFQNYIINAIHTIPNNMELGKKVRKYVDEYENFRKDVVDVPNINEYKT